MSFIIIFGTLSFNVFFVQMSVAVLLTHFKYGRQIESRVLCGMVIFMISDFKAKMHKIRFLLAL